MTPYDEASGSCFPRRVVVLACNVYRTVYTYSPQVLLGATEWGIAHNWDVIDISHWNWRIPEGIKPDGLISLDHTPNGPAADLHKTISNSVAVRGNQLPEGVPNIDSDSSAIGELAAEYFLQRGFRNFAIVAYHESRWDPRLNVFKTSVEREGAHCSAICDLTEDGSERGCVSAGGRFKEELSRLTFPLALFCRNDFLGTRVIRWCVEEGVAVPEQVAVLGCGNEVLTCRCSPVALSSIDSDHQRMGAEAARVLQAMMDGLTEQPESCLVAPKGVITRRSTDMAAIPDLTAARALRYIWDNYRANIWAEQVAAVIGVHRRTLDRHFTEALGRSVAKEINRRRLVAACEMLKSSDTAIANVAAMCGFSTPQYFNYLFRRSLGMTPQRYRKEWVGPPHHYLLIKDR